MGSVVHEEMAKIEIKISCVSQNKHVHLLCQYSVNEKISMLLTDDPFCNFRC
jgi:hypothetical protein